MNSRIILVVDDEPGVRFSVSLILSSMDFKVIEAENGIEALKILAERSRRNQDVDLVISDIRMPGMDGLKFMKSMAVWQDKEKVIVMTGYGNREVVRQLHQMGYKQIIDKPFSVEVLMDSVYSSFDK